MSLINLLTTLLVKAYRNEAARHHKQADKSRAARQSFLDEANEYRHRAIDAELAASECLAAQIDSLNAREAHYDKAAEVERFFKV